MYRRRRRARAALPCFLCTAVLLALVLFSRVGNDGAMQDPLTASAHTMHTHEDLPGRGRSLRRRRDSRTTNTLRVNEAAMVVASVETVHWPSDSLHHLVDQSMRDVVASNALRLRYKSACLQDVRRWIVDEMRPHFDGVNKVALLGVPTHGNLGDNILHLAEVHLIAMFGKSPAITCPTFHHRQLPMDKCPHPSELLDKLGPNPLILLHAGGNWGDLWLEGHAGRLEYLRQLEGELRVRNGEARVVQLPQSMYYADAKMQAADKEALQDLRHINLTVYCRQESSLAYAPNASDRLSVKLMPDTAFLLSPMDVQAGPPHLDVLVLLRTDHEGVNGMERNKAKALANATLPDAAVEVKDWLVPVDPVAGEFERSSPSVFPLVRFVMAQRLISGAKVVITDRLHASITALLTDRHHIMIDNSYGKLAGVRDLALQGDDGACGDRMLRARKAKDLHEALAIARSILGAPFVIS